MSKIDKPIVPNPRNSQFDKPPKSSGLFGLDQMSMRLNLEGGFKQQSRMIHDKNWTLQRAIKHSYQGAQIRKINEKNIVPALINPDKTKANYDDKILSVGYEFGFHPGDIFEWIETGTLWLVTLQELTELAYFRSEIRRCNYTISWIDPETKETHTIHAAIRGPIETQISYFQKHSDSVDRPNNSLSIYMPKTKETLEYFRRYSKFYLGELDDGDENLCWRVEAKDSISMPGVLELMAEEYYVNEFTDDLEEGLAGGITLREVKAAPQNIGYIEGPNSIMPRTTAEFIYRGKRVDEWTWDKTLPIKAKVDGRTIKIVWSENYSGSFVLSCGMAEKEIKVKSLF